MSHRQSDDDNTPEVTRRDALKVIGATAASASTSRMVSAQDAGKDRQPTKRPNILYIFTDQQSATMMSGTGNQYLKTPAMDSLAETGVRFERAYCANPVCVPSRFSMMTGRMPSVIGMGCNNGGTKPIPDAMQQQGMGWLLRSAGYDAAYGGKVHLPKGMNVEKIGFDPITGDQRAGLADACVEFLKEKREKPFLLVASFINPHDICYMAINAYGKTHGKEPVGGKAWECMLEALKRPEGVSEEEFFAKLCPPVPENYEIPENEPEAITHIVRQRRFKEYARNKWSDKQWRMHRWAFCRLTEMVDAHIARVLQALRETGQEESTVVVFSSDHGDMDAAHRMEHKTALYEEPTRVPFIISQKGVTKPGAVDEKHLVSNGLDLIPTLCDYAGIDPPEDLLGTSVRVLAEGREPDTWRDRLAVESEFGRMMRSDRYKYNVYRSGKRREQLIDLQNDPGDMNNLANDPAHKDVLLQHRKWLYEWVDETNDEIGKQHMIR